MNVDKQTRTESRSAAVHHIGGAYAMHLLRIVAHPNPRFGAILPAGLDLVGEFVGREVRLTSDLLPEGSLMLPLREGVDFTIVDLPRKTERGGR